MSCNLFLLLCLFFFLLLKRSLENPAQPYKKTIQKQGLKKKQKSKKNTAKNKLNSAFVSKHRQYNNRASIRIVFQSLIKKHRSYCFSILCGASAGLAMGVKYVGLLSLPFLTGVLFWNLIAEKLKNLNKYIRRFDCWRLGIYKKPQTLWNFSCWKFRKNKNFQC